MGHPDYEVTGGSAVYKGRDLFEVEPEERSHMGLFLRRAGLREGLGGLGCAGKSCAGLGLAGACVAASGSWHQADVPLLGATAWHAGGAMAAPPPPPPPRPAPPPPPPPRRRRPHAQLCSAPPAPTPCCRSFQSPVEIPGVSNIDFLRIATNARRKARGEGELDPLEFYAHVMPKVPGCWPGACYFT